MCMQEDILVGYILFSSLKRRYIIKIKHFCVSKEFRRNKIGELLFREFKKTIRDAYYIELSCRDDYHLNSFWHQLGFDIVKAREGRAVNSLSILHQFRCKLQGDFLSILDECEQRPKIQLDSSIIFSLNLDSKDFTGDNSLLIYWNDVVFCVAQVVFEDIERQEDEKIKRESIEKANKYYKLPVSIPAFSAISEKIRIEFPQVSESDRKQLACAVANKISHFITKDKQLLGLFQAFAENYQLLIQSPVEFYSHFDSILNREKGDSYFPTAHGKLIDINFSAPEMCARYLNYSTGETRQKFLEIFEKNIHDSKLKSVTINNEVVGIVFYASKCNALSIYALRLRQNKLNIAYNVSSFILRELIQIASQNGMHSVHLTDNGVHPETALASIDLGFSNNKKLCARYIGEEKDFHRFLTKRYECDINDILNEYLSGDSCYVDQILRVDKEKKYFPAKFVDIEIPSYVIPISPLWAKDLLTPEIEDQHSLINSKKSDVIIPTNSVYFSSKKQHINTPARVLWYVTKGRQNSNSNFQWKGNVIASSYIDEVHIGTKSDIFKKFWRLGVYDWRDINKNSGTMCTAIVFSRTEIFNTKICYDEMTNTISELMHKGTTPISVFPVSSEVFFSLYQKGFNCERFS
ncbi:GNAT family N-acetyltransferase [Desulfovibrio sp. 3_1_syn3]|uniref:GNAT family N-acetyltransferase n=1 Tax=Desulfovibrio sp. 3_1_syn3 TaxID=457398 RepID=UPI002FBEF452